MTDLDNGIEASGATAVVTAAGSAVTMSVVIGVRDNWSGRYSDAETAYAQKRRVKDYVLQTFGDVLPLERTGFLGYSPNDSVDGAWVGQTEVLAFLREVFADAFPDGSWTVAENDPNGDPDKICRPPKRPGDPWQDDSSAALGDSEGRIATLSLPAAGGVEALEVPLRIFASWQCSCDG